MGILSRETYLVQNPALGAVLLWRYTVGYAKGSKVNSPSPLPLLFIPLPVLLNKESIELIRSTRQNSGLRFFASKFGESKTSKNDVLLAIHDAAIDYKDLSLESLRLGLSSNLMGLDAKEGVVVPLHTTSPKVGIPESVRHLISAAEKFGFWCGELTLHEVSTILKIGF
jgi:hypothetical protein